MDEYRFPPSPSLGQLMFAAFMQAALTEFAKYTATEIVRDLIEPRRIHRKRRKRLG